MKTNCKHQVSTDSFIEEFNKALCCSRIRICY